MQDVFIGVDVAKAELVIASEDQRRSTLPNQARSIAQWLSSLPAQALIAMESTGAFHQLLALMAHQAGLRVFVLNARDVHFYAKALGCRAKSDGVDAGVIRRYLMEHHQHLHPWMAASQAQQQLRLLVSRRAQIVSHQVALRQSLRGLALEGTQALELQQSFKRLLAAIDAQIEQWIASDEQLSQGSQRLLSITGVGLQTSALLTSLLSHIPFGNADALVAYCGLDPRANDSGAKKGKRRLSKRGPALLRRQIYLVGFAASHSKALKPLYEAIRGEGFTSTEALVILGRKLLRAAFAIWRGKQTFDPARLYPKTA